MRVPNFNPGPAALPLPVLERARDELIDFQGSGMSIMEHSHRGKHYEAVHNEAIALLREIAGIGDSHHVLFLQGGASLQFAMLPMNLVPPGRSADYVNTGNWSQRAIEEAQALAEMGMGGKVRIAATTQSDKFTRVPRKDEIAAEVGAAYLHITTNNTIEGTQYHYLPETGKVPLVADMSSDFLCRKLDLTRFGLIYAGAQKNLGPSGVTLVVARKDLVEPGRKELPAIFRYATFAAANSLYNTPPTFAIYLVRNVLAWIKSVGGLAQIEAWNQEKARLLYAAIDARPDYYRCPVAKDARSLMNVVFRLPTPALEEQFVKEAGKAHLEGLKGHRSVGGMRASLYNAVTVKDVQTLCGFMDEFARQNPTKNPTG
jgi:phosphoserine aminotransferase